MANEANEIIVSELKVTLSPWPKTGMQVLSLLIVAVFLLVLVGILAYKDVFRHDVLDAVNTGYRVWYQSKDAPVEPLHSKYYRLAFWTPSEVTTADQIKKYAPQEVPEDKRWQMGTDEKKLQDFGAFLTTKLGRQLLGYRREPVFGQGQRSTKNGSWWTLSVESTVNLQTFAGYYREFWKTKEDIYIETTGDVQYVR